MVALFLGAIFFFPFPKYVVQKGEFLFHVSTRGDESCDRKALNLPELRILWEQASCPIEGSFDESPRGERLTTVSQRARETERARPHHLYFFCVCRFAHVTRSEEV